MIDLHTHTTYSDGSLTPAELVQAAKNLEITALAVTDHDTIEGVAEAITAGKTAGIQIISGVEFSVDHEDGSLHLLGYGFDHTNQPLIDLTTTLRQSRVKRNERIIARLVEMGYQISVDEVISASPDGTHGRSHMADFLVKTEQVASVDVAFDTLLSRGEAAYFDRYRPPMKHVIELIHSAGGVSVWAHPGLHNPERMEILIERLPRWRDLGLDGVECDYSLHSVELRDRLAGIAERNQLVSTGGSDYHGGLKSDSMLGSGAGGISVSEELLTALTNRLSKRRERHV